MDSGQICKRNKIDRNLLTIKNDAIYLIEMMDNKEFLLFLFYLTIIEKCKSSLYTAALLVAFFD